MHVSYNRLSRDFATIVDRGISHFTSKEHVQPILLKQ